MGRIIWRGALVALLININGAVAQAKDSLEPIIDDVASYWSPIINDSKVGDPIDISAGVLEEVTPAQMLAPQRRPSMRVAENRRQRRTAANSSSGLSSVPFMIGDTGAGTCFAFTGLLDVELSHPTLTCNRLNISENNSPLPTDRLYFSYRHFENVSNLRYFQFEEAFDVDRFTLGGEKTFFDGIMSFEMRLPIENRLSSERFSYDVFDPPVFLDPAVFPPGFAPFGGGTRAELGNISFLLKALIHETDSFAFSAGLGVTMPTAQDVEYLVTTDNRLVFPSVPGATADSSVLLDVFGSNETIYLSPYLAWLSQKQNSRFFHQGFLQVEVAANPSSIAVAGDGLTNFVDPNNNITGTFDWFTPFPTGRTDLFAQTLMRLNLGFGYMLVEDECADFIQQLTGMFEVHYTTTLQDAIISSVPLGVNASGTTGVNPVQTLEFGNLLNRVDIVNMVFGLSARSGNWVITNGVTVPISTSEQDNPFDFEYNLQTQRIF